MFQMIFSHNFVSYTCLEQTTHAWIEVFINMSYININRNINEIFNSNILVPKYSSASKKA